MLLAKRLSTFFRHFQKRTAAFISIALAICFLAVSCAGGGSAPVGSSSNSPDGIEVPVVAESLEPDISKEESGLKISILEDSFAKIVPDADEFVLSFYDNLLTDYPDAKPLFAHVDLINQSQMLKGGLILVVDNLREPEVLGTALKDLGARHVQYGALPEHYPLVGNSLLKTFEQYLKDDWTPEVKEAWTEAFGVITALMLEGADYST